MYKQIKEMAEEALKLQNKNFMDETLKKIIELCDYEHNRPKFIWPPQVAMTDELRRQLDDSELLASAPSGFAGKKLDGAATFTPGEFKPVGVGAADDAPKFSGPEFGQITKALMAEGEQQTAADDGADGELAVHEYDAKKLVDEYATALKRAKKGGAK